MKRRQPKNPRRCHFCFRIVGVSRHGVMPFHKTQEGDTMVRCPGTGRIAG